MLWVTTDIESVTVFPNDNVKNKYHPNFIIMINGRKKLAVTIRYGPVETWVYLNVYLRACSYLLQYDKFSLGNEV